MAIQLVEFRVGFHQIAQHFSPPGVFAADAVGEAQHGHSVHGGRSLPEQQ